MTGLHRSLQFITVIWDRRASIYRNMIWRCGAFRRRYKSDSRYVLTDSTPKPEASSLLIADGVACCVVVCPKQTINPLSAEYVEIGSTLNNLGCCLYELRRFGDAYTYFLSAEEVFTNKLDRVQPRLNAVRQNMEKIAPLRKKIHTEELITAKKTPVPPPKRVTTKKGANKSGAAAGSGSGSGSGSAASAPAKPSTASSRGGAPPPTPPPKPVAKTAPGVIELRSWRIAMTEFNRLIELHNKPKSKKKKKKVAASKKPGSPGAKSASASASAATKK